MINPDRSVDRLAHHSFPESNNILRIHSPSNKRLWSSLALSCLLDAAVGIKTPMLDGNGRNDPPPSDGIRGSFPMDEGRNLHAPMISTFALRTRCAFDGAGASLFRSCISEPLLLFTQISFIRHRMHSGTRPVVIYIHQYFIVRQKQYL